MQFLRECALRLDAGEEAEAVLASMRERFTTPRCLSVKTSLVRSLCTPTEEYLLALEDACARLPHLERELRSGRPPRNREGGEEEVERGEGSSDAEREEAGGARRRQEAVDALRALPPRLAPNARALRVTRAQKAECKRLSARAAIAKNVTKTRVDGRSLLAAARRVVEGAEAASTQSLALALMLLTGRRTCEVLNGRSSLAPLPCHTHAASFRGLAKRRGDPDVPLRVPLLAPAEQVVRGLSALRAKQGGRELDNAATSRRYQSLLARTLAADPVWAACGKVHGLRGAYACMCLRLFEWGDASDAYVAMCVLGHTSLLDSLVYTTFSLGEDFVEETPLGEGCLSEHL
jgi:integrase